MANNTFGHLFRVTTFGESHGGAVGVVIDGCPPRLKILEEDIQKELNRRKPGQSSITSMRKEEDKISILSGVFEGKTTGTPILMLVNNKNAKPSDYVYLKNLYRPGHADYTFQMKYGIRDWRGGGRASARETIGRVAAGAIAKKYLKEKLKIEILSYVEQIGNIRTDIDLDKVSIKNIESNIIRCPDQKTAQKMITLVNSIKKEGDSIGGIVCGVIRNMPYGLGEPVFDKLSADLGKAMLSINAVKGFEIGSGFKGVHLRGSEYNDEFYINNFKKIKNKTNNAGGVLGGISNGENVYFRIAVKPTSTISKQQKTVNKNGNAVKLKIIGRHDPCVLPRIVPVVDAMASLVIIDHYLRHKAQNL